MVRLALPNKGRLQDDVRTLLDDAGLPIRDKSERSLSARLGAGDFEAIFLRAEDIPELVADGAADAGITGFDLVAESGRELTELLDLEFGRCRLVVAAREGVDLERPGQLDRPRVATRFPRLARAFFEKRGFHVDLVPVSGSVEIAPHLGIADMVVDLTSTGSTLRVNGLRELATVLSSSARLIARPQAAELVEFRELGHALSSVLRARTRRYLMANVPRTRLDEVRERLPGLNGPTLSEVLGDGQFVAMHAVVSIESVYKTVAVLKALGCEGILVTRIERLMP